MRADGDTGQEGLCDVLALKPRSSSSEGTCNPSGAERNELNACRECRSGRKAIVATVSEMLEGICHAAQNHEDTFGLLIKYKSVDCLVLDDWGKERWSDARMDYMYQILEYRYQRDCRR